MECDWKNTRGYLSGAEVIDQLHPLALFLWVWPLLFLVLRQRDLPRKRRLLLGL